MMVASNPRTTILDVQCLVEKSANASAAIAHEVQYEIQKVCPPLLCFTRSCLAGVTPKKKRCAAKVRGVMSSSGYRPLHFAATSGNAEVAGSLIDFGADVDAVDLYNSTALHVASFEGRSNFVDLLVGAGADVNMKDAWGQHPLHSAAQGRNASSRSAPFKRRFVAVVESLVARGAEVDAKDVDGMSPLHFAAESGSRKMVAVLVESGADINGADVGGRTPLHVAASLGICRIYKVLVDAGADEGLRDGEGSTPKEVLQANSASC